MKLGDLFIKLGLKSEEFNQGLEKAKGGLSGLGTVAKSIGGVLAAAFSIGAMVRFFTTSVKLANEQIAVENELAAALRANGMEVDANMNKYKRFASAMQRVTTVGDETTLSLIRLAVTMQSKAPEEAAKMAIGLSKALGMDLQTATRAAVLAQNGNTIALSRYIPEIRTATTEAEKLAAVHRIVAGGMEIARAETETLTGKIDRIKNAWGDLKEVIGTVIATNDTLLSSIEDMTLAIEMLSTKKFGFTSFLAFLAGGKSWEADKKRFIEMIKQQEDMNAAMDEYEQNIKSAREPLGQLSAESSKYGRTISEIEQEISDLKESLKGYGEFQGKEIQATLRQIDANEKLLKSLLELRKARAENRAVGAIQPGKQFDEPLVGREKYAGLMRDLSPVDTSQLDDMTAWFIRNNELTKKYTDEYLENFVRFKEDFNYLITDFGIDVVEQFGSMLGELMATGQVSGDFGKNILASIGSFIGTLGKMLIGLGMASEAFQKTLASGFLTGGVSLIAAGAALVALGGAISSFARSRGSAGGQSGGRSEQPSGGFGVFETNQRGSFQLPQMSTSIRGNELVLLINRESNRTSGIT